MSYGTFQQLQAEAIADALITSGVGGANFTNQQTEIARLEAIRDRLPSTLTAGGRLTVESAPGTVNTTPSLAVINCATANVEVSSAVTTSRLLILTARTNAIRYAFAINKVATLTEPYRTLAAGATITIPITNGCRWSGTIYAASTVAGSVLEIESWS